MGNLSSYGAKDLQDPFIQVDLLIVLRHRQMRQPWANGFCTCTSRECVNSRLRLQKAGVWRDVSNSLEALRAGYFIEVICPKQRLLARRCSRAVIEDDARTGRIDAPIGIDFKLPGAPCAPSN